MAITRTDAGETAPDVREDTGTAARLRLATLSEHRAAEDREFIARLTAGELSLGEYTRYLAQFGWVYAALEARIPEPDDPALFDPALARSASIRHDLLHLGVADWRSENPPLPATEAYVAHLASIPANDTVRWVAHHYTRYLGDLSGGQAIGRLVARHYGAAPEQLTFYDFADIENLVAYRGAYREGLDALELSSAEREVLVVEVRRAYEMNSALFDDLAQS